MEVTITIRGDLEAFRRCQRVIAGGLAAPGCAPFDTMFNQWADYFCTFTRRRFMINSRGGGDWAPLAVNTILGRRPFAKGKAKAKINGRRQYMRAMVRAAGAASSTEGKWDEMAKASFADQAADSSRFGGTKFAGKAANILYDTGVLFNALSIGAPGNITERSGPSVTFGIGGDEMHPTAQVYHAQKDIVKKDIKKRGARAAGCSLAGAVTISQIAAYHDAGGGHLPQRTIIVEPPAGDPFYGQMERAANVAVNAVIAGTLRG